jgi:CsoR family transcriptional regulator, copper-sensing transcriptional repressor
MDEANLAPDVQSSTQSTLSRLRRIEGQIRGLQRMVESEEDCSAILTQLLAVRAALDAVVPQMIELYMERCVNNADEREVRERLLRVIQLFLRMA